MGGKYLCNHSLLFLNSFAKITVFPAQYLICYKSWLLIKFTNKGVNTYAQHFIRFLVFFLQQDSNERNNLLINHYFIVSRGVCNEVYYEERNEKVKGSDQMLFRTETHMQLKQNELANVAM